MLIGWSNQAIGASTIISAQDLDFIYTVGRNSATIYYVDPRHAKLEVDQKTPSTLMYLNLANSKTTE
jgi:hypothetical protein